MKNKTKLVLTLLSATTIMIAGYYWYSSSRSKAIDYSLVQLVDAQHFPAYQIKKDVKSLETDSSGEWWLSLDKSFSTNMVNEEELKLADAADTAYMVKVFSEKVNSDIKENEEFMLFRGEKVLGEDSICAQSPCNIYVLAKAGTRDVYVALYKN